MHDSKASLQPLDEFIAQLLGAGAVLSQIITQMVRYDAARGGAPDAVPIPQAAHELLASVLTDVRRRYSRRDLIVAARMLKEATDRICQEVCFVSPDLADDGDG
jgi:hypothetical protein